MEITTLLQGNLSLLSKAIAKRVIEKTIPPLNMMELFLTEACNLRCDYCFVATKRAYRRMSWEVAKRAIDFLMKESKEEKEVEILFFGGEPLLAFPLMRKVAEYAVQKADSLGKKVSFTCTTNATLLTEEHLRFAQQYGFLYLLSIDGVKEVHDKYRVKANGQGSFDDIMKKLPMLKRLQGWLGTRMTVNPDTVHRLSESVQALFEMGINQFLIGVNTDVPWSKEAMRTYAREMKKVWEFYQQKKREGAPIRIVEFDETLEERRNRLCSVWGCDAGRTRVAVSIDGKLYPCARFVSTYPEIDGKYCLGDVWQGWTDLEKRLDLMAGLERRTKCQNCKLASFCTGGCPAVNLYTTGNLPKQHFTNFVFLRRARLPACRFSL